jgi:hypothetical protein
MVLKITSINLLATRELNSTCTVNLLNMNMTWNEEMNDSELNLCGRWSLQGSNFLLVSEFSVKDKFACRSKMMMIMKSQSFNFTTFLSEAVSLFMNQFTLMNFVNS